MNNMNPFNGIQIIGYVPDRSAVLLRIERGAAFRLAEGCSPQFEPFFTGIGESLREAVIAFTSAPSTPSMDELRTRVPRQFKPYLKYTEEQMKAAWSQSQLASDRHYCGEGYARLYFTRAALVEMYRRPPHLRLVYSSILKMIDGHYGSGVTHLGEEPEYRIPDEQASPRLTPYEGLEESQMRKALNVLGIPRAQIKVSYGLLAATFHRDTLFRLCKRSWYAKPAIAYLLKRYDEMFGITQSPRKAPSPH